MLALTHANVKRTCSECTEGYDMRSKIMVAELNARQETILDLLSTDGIVKVEEISAKFDVTPQTVRRDLASLCGRGLAVRTHGGARRLDSASDLVYEERRLANREIKSAIATTTAELIPNHSSVMLNIGTTTEQVARALTLHEGLVVVSNNINVINILQTSRLDDLILVGGSVRQSDGAIVGEDAVEFLTRYKTDFAVIGTSALDQDGAVMDFDGREVAVARAILNNARTKILVADGSKFDRNAPVRICDIADLDFFVTDQQPSQNFLMAAKAGGTQVLFAKSS